MGNERQEKIEALLSMDIQKLKLIKFGVPPIKWLYTEVNSGVYYNEAGDLVTRKKAPRKEVSKANPMADIPIISDWVVTYPLGTDVAEHVKARAALKQPAPITKQSRIRV